MRTAIGYGRFSSDLQREESITAQKRAIDEYCEKNEIVLVDFYTDEGISGMTDERPGFQAMIAAAHEVDHVIVHKLDRFARNRYDAAIYRKKLEQVGTSLLSVLENFDNSPESIILESVITGMNEYYSRNLAREVKKGLLETARQGNHAGGTPPLGYDLQDGKYIINETEAAIVRRIFQATIEGVSYAELATELNAKGCLSKAGRPFVRNSFYDLLKNEKYIGTYIYNVSDSSSTNGKRNYHKRHSEDKIIRIEGAIPPIVTQQEFDEVKEILRRRKKGYQKHNHYLLSGLVVCGECGAVMNGSVTKKQNHVRYLYYKCSARCGSKRIRADKLDQWISDMVSDLLIHPGNAKAIICRAMELATQAKKPDALQTTIKQEKEVQRKIDNIVRALADAYSPALNNQLEEYESQLRYLKMERLGMERSVNKSRDDYIALFQQYAKFKTMPAAKKKMLIAMLISKIKIHRDHQITVDLRNVPLQVASRVGVDLVQKGCDLYYANSFATETGSTLIFRVA